MLVLGRHEGQSIRIGDDIVIMICKINPGLVRIGIEAPDEIKITRTEIEGRDPEKKT